MKERPILYSTPMVIAKLEGRKTQTRRVLKQEWLRCLTIEDDYEKIIELCPYGKVGDWLWVRETWCYSEDETGNHSNKTKGDCFGRFLYKSMGDKPHGHWKPSIFMPKEAARIWEEIVDIRVERLNNISENDAIAEGIIKHSEQEYKYSQFHSGYYGSAVGAYSDLWEHINSKGSWDINPWVWVIETRILSTVGKPKVKFASL